MATDRLDNAILTVNRAIEADNAGKYEEALEIYKMALSEFVHIVKWAKNPKVKEMIHSKTVEYLDRAEKLKSFIEANNSGGGAGAGPGAGGPNAPVGDASNRGLVGSNGKGGKFSSGGGGGDDEKEKLRHALSSAVVQERPNVRWEDVAGLEAAKDALKEAVVLPLKFPALFQGKRQPWRGILLYGPPGTGKSYLAKAVATEANSAFFSITSADVVSKWMGEGERLMRTLFEMARENRPAVIFVDEIDAFGGDRDKTDSEASRRILTELLVQMDGVGKDNKDVLVLAATNHPWRIDGALRRRFQRRIHIGLPDAAARLKMFQLSVGDTETNLQQRDYQDLVVTSDGYSGSDITMVVQQALYKPIHKIMQATHFKKVKIDGAARLTPCSPGDPEAQEMTYNEVEANDLIAPVVTASDIRVALKEMRPSVSPDDKVRMDQWTAEFGSEGS